MIRTVLIIFCLLATLPASAQKPKPYNCEEPPQHRQFDFWLGTWKVTDKAGEQAYGRNTISKRENGCLLLEEYQTGKGFSGSSINFYNPSDSRWYQYWVDNGTSIIQTSGGLKNGSMVMRGKIYYLQSGRTAKFRAKWTPLEDGRVRQFFEEKDSQGKWQPWFDGYYRKYEAE